VNSLSSERDYIFTVKLLEDCQARKVCTSLSILNFMAVLLLRIDNICFAWYIINALEAKIRSLPTDTYHRRMFGGMFFSPMSALISSK
jgi:hypothetical protein